MRSTISPPKVLTVRSNSEIWRVITAPSVPLSRANFSASSLPWFFTNSSKRLMSRHDCVSAGEDLRRQAIAGFIDFAHQVAAAQFEFQQQGVAGILQRVMNLFGSVRNSVDDGRRALLEFVGDAVDPLVQHLVDAVGQVDELVMHVTSLEVKAGGEAFAGVEHGARGLGAGFLKAIEQVAAARAAREAP